MSNYRLTRLAERDLVKIWEYTVNEWSLKSNFQVEAENGSIVIKPVPQQGWVRFNDCTAAAVA